MIFQLISLSPPSHISSVAILHILCRRINPCCPTSPPPCLTTSVFTADLLCHIHYPGAMIHPEVGSRFLSIVSQSISALPTRFAISVVLHLICCRPTSPPPPYPFVLSRISTTMTVWRCFHHWRCMPSLLFCISTAPPLLSYRVSVAVFIALSSIVPCTLPPLFFYLLQSDILLLLQRSVIHCLIRSVPHYFYCYPLWSSHYNFIFIFARLFSLSVIFFLRSNLPRFYPLAFTLSWSNPIIPLSSVCSNLLAPSILC